MNNSVIIDGGRSPIGLKNGKLIGMRADDLCANVVQKLLKRNENIDKKYYVIITLPTYVLKQLHFLGISK